MLDLLPELTFEDLDPAQPGGLRLLEALLGKGWVAAVVFCGPMTVLARDHVPPLGSPHGVLCSMYVERQALLSNGCGHHVVVFCEWGTRGVVTIDPWHGPEGQPFVMSREWLVRVMTGHLWRPG